MSPQEWINAVLDALQEALESGEEISDELANAIADAIEQEQAKIQSQQAAQLTSTIPPGADLLWILSGGQPDAFASYLREFPDPALNSLLRNPTQLAQTLEYLQANLPQGRTGEQDGIQQAPLQSSNIYGFRYDPRTKKLLVRFQGGSVYSYTGVPPGIFRIFEKGAIPAKTSGKNAYGRWWVGKSPSMGAAFHALIKLGGYPYQRLS